MHRKSLGIKKYICEKEGIKMKQLKYSFVKIIESKNGSDIISQPFCLSSNSFPFSVSISERTPFFSTPRSVDGKSLIFRSHLKKE